MRNIDIEMISNYHELKIKEEIKMSSWVIERPADCQSCIAQGNHANTPVIILDTSTIQFENEMDGEIYPQGSIRCRWCGIEITAPSLPESIAKWASFQEIIRVGYSTLNGEAIFKIGEDLTLRDFNNPTAKVIASGRSKQFEGELKYLRISTYIPTGSVRYVVTCNGTQSYDSRCFEDAIVRFNAL